jgi:hypothetical protein
VNRWKPFDFLRVQYRWEYPRICDGHIETNSNNLF